MVQKELNVRDYDVDGIIVLDRVTEWSECPSHASQDVFSIQRKKKL